MAPAVEKNVCGVVMTPSLGPIPAAINEIRSASVPEETPTAYFEAQYRLISFSNVSTDGPKIKYGGQTRVFRKGDSIAVSGSTSYHIGTVGDEPLCMLQVEVSVGEKRS